MCSAHDVDTQDNVLIHICMFSPRNVVVVVTLLCIVWKPIFLLVRITMAAMANCKWTHHHHITKANMCDMPLRILMNAGADIEKADNEV